MSAPLAVAAFACGSSPATSGFAAPDGAPPSSLLPDGGGDAACSGLACAVATCSDGSKTTVEGDVYDPAGKNKLYDVLVYVPNAPLTPLVAGPTCDLCGAPPSGSPLAIALTDERGHFVLENVPAGDHVPLVIQVGKWRRTLELPHVEACANTPTTDGSIRLPRNSKEGDIPKMAVVTGGFDDLPCVLRNIGIDDAEMTGPAGPGRIHIYAGATGGFADIGPTPPATELWGAPASGTSAAIPSRLREYDQVVLTCEGWEYTTEEPSGRTVLKSPEARRAMRDYLDAGGRVFAEHYQYTWFKNNPEPDLASVATWRNPPQSTYGNLDLTVDTSFPKGRAFAAWLAAVGASPKPGILSVSQPSYNVEKATPGISQAWLKNGTETVPYLTFNAPVGKPEAEQCGRAAITDIEVSGQLKGNVGYPSTCAPHALSPQERAFEFFFFDLSACVVPDSQTPKPPVLK